GELPDVNGDGSSDGNNGLSDVNDFSLRNILIICVTVIGVVGAILFFIFKRGSFPIQINH
ncbi:MAG: hypothetical protein LBE76_07240, partial [Nitrososphaerota archaeon]|nr:hypothetical protein [Nitrososphaerota archaeon]